MKLVPDHLIADRSHVDSIPRALSALLVKLGVRKAAPSPSLSLREQHEALIDSQSRYTHEQRLLIHERAAALPLDDQAIAEGDDLFASLVESRKAELPRNPVPTGVDPDRIAVSSDAGFLRGADRPRSRGRSIP